MKSIKEKSEEYAKDYLFSPKPQRAPNIHFEAGANYVLDAIEKFMVNLNLGSNSAEKFYKLDLMADELYEKYGFSHKDAISWLEKQGGHANFRNKIQIGDKVTRNKDGVLVNLSQLNRVAKKQGEQKPVNWFEELEEKLANATPEQIKEWKEKYFNEKPVEWSEKDEKMRTRCAAFLGYQYQGGMMTRKEYKEAHNWLESLKDRVQPKVELTQLDKNILEAAIAFVEQNDHFNCWRGVDKRAVLSALYSLKPQSQWKPSDEQMMYLSEAIDVVTRAEKFSIATALKELREQLKKLK